MTSLSRAPTERDNRYKSLRNFYLADQRRRSSREQDVGLWWRVGAHGPVYRAAWVRATGELYITRLGSLDDGTGEVLVLGRARDRDQLEEALEGWRDVCPQPDSMTWLRHRAARLEPAQKPARSLASASPVSPHGTHDAGVSRLRRPDAPRPSARPAARHGGRPALRPKGRDAVNSTVAARGRS
jgi:hypothetical protein